MIALELLAAIELFRLRNIAVSCFMAAWIARVMLTTYDIAESVRSPHFIAVLVVALIGLGVFTSVLAYAAHLKRKGVLRPGA